MKRGTHHTLEARAKMMGNKNAEGHTDTPEARAKKCAAHQDISLSPEHCAAIAVGAKGNKNAEGHVHSPETIAKMRAAHVGKCCGPNNPAWAGGVSRDPYGWDFNDELKEEVRRRDGYKCQLCGVPQAECRTRLPVHHIDYDKKNSDPVNLTALCVSCNSKVNKNRKHWTAFFRAMMLKRAIASLGADIRAHKA